VTTPYQNFSVEDVSVYANALHLIRSQTPTQCLIIDLGCGSGALASSFASEGWSYVGFDQDSDSVAALHQRGFEADTIDLEDFSELEGKLAPLLANPHHQQVFIVLLDVVEHLVNPDAFLRQLHALTQAHAKSHLVLSIPNFSHSDVAIKLLAGQWEYTPSGLLDSTHKIIFTEQHLNHLMQSSGWHLLQASDYAQELSDQYFLRPQALLNRQTGIGKLLRAIKSQLDPNAQTHQFVRLYSRESSIFSQATSQSTPDIPWGWRVCPPNWKTNPQTGWERMAYWGLNFNSTHCAPDFWDKALCEISNHQDKAVAHAWKTSVWVSQSQSATGGSVKSLIDALTSAHSQSNRERMVRILIEDTNTVWLLPCAQLGLVSPPPTHEDARDWAVYLLNAITALGLVQVAASAAPTQAEIHTLHFEPVWIDVAWANMSYQALPFLQPYFAPIDNLLSDSRVQQKNLMAWADSREALVSTLQADVVRLASDVGDQRIWIDNREHALEQALADLSIQSSSVTNLNSRIGVLNELLAIEQGELAATQGALAAAQGELGSTRTHLNQKELEIQTILRSTSWRVTKPLRWLGRLMAPGGMRHALRSTYQHIPLLQKIKGRYNHWIANALSHIDRHSSSVSNGRAIADLTARRFSTPVYPPDPNGMKRVQIDLSVVTFNSEKWVDQFFESLCKQNFPLVQIHLVFVDHGSHDQTVTALCNLRDLHQHRFASFQVIEQANAGFGAGHDRAIRSTSSEFCLVSNIDLEFEPDAISAIAAQTLQDENKQVASWELRQMPYEHPKYYDPVTLETNWSSHACILLRRSAYIKVGGYDDGIFMYAEDVELSYRFRSFGYALRYVPQAVVMHYTYEAAAQLKPLQYTGSVMGNLYVRLRYGNRRDRLIGLGLFFARFFYPEPFPGAKKSLVKKISSLPWAMVHFTSGKGTAKAHFPLRGYDYDMIRDGAFYQLTPLRHTFDFPKEIVQLPPLVTIITRTYQGRGNLLAQCLRSVLNQTYSNIECIVAEDGGDTQQGIVSTYQTLARSGVSLRFLANEKVGRSATGNAALAAAKGEFVMFLDDDDLIFADHVEVLASSLIANKASAAAYSLAYEIHTNFSSDKSSYDETIYFTPSVFRQEWDYTVMEHHNFIPIQAILFRRELYLERGGFDNSLDQLEDWNLWLRYGHNNHFAYIPKTTSLFRTPSNPTIREDRHLQLHLAYEIAQQKAQHAIKNNFRSS
jgi:GT2 family glycosyltransferase/2-polyprenyl-3-methyl-5-hydroxy-6-metoxy-1,4-benzoquinol methylase